MSLSFRSSPRQKPSLQDLCIVRGLKYIHGLTLRRMGWGSNSLSCFLLQKPGRLIVTSVPDPLSPFYEVSCWVCLSFLDRKNIGRLNLSLTKKGKLNELKRRNRFAVKRLVVFLSSLWAVAFVCPVETIHRAAYLVEGQSEVIWSNLIGQSSV